jgi:hypothetical protein
VDNKKTPPRREKPMSHRRKYSYSYLLEQLEDYRTKVEDPFWSWMKPLLKELCNELEYKLHHIKEQEPCIHFQEERILASILQTTNSHS